MNWGKALGYSALVWVVVFVVISALVPSGTSEAVWVPYLTTVIVVMLAWLLAGKLGVTSVGEGFKYGLVWLIVAVVLDYLISLPYAPDLYSMWSVWVGYVVFLVAPMLNISKVANKSS